MPDRYQIFDVKNNQLVYTAMPLRTKPIARAARRTMAKMTGEPTRFIVVPGPEHRKWQINGAPTTSAEKDQLST